MRRAATGLRFNRRRVTVPPKEASGGGRVILRSAQRVAIGALSVVAVIASSLAAPPAAPPQTPAEQLTVAQSGVRFRLGPFFLGPDWIVMTLIVENERSAGVHVAAIYRRDDSGVPRVALSDGSGGTCQAAEPMGISSVSDPGGAEAGGTETGGAETGAEAPAAPIASMTELGPHSRMNISLRFPSCRLSKTGRLSLSGKFAISVDGQTAEVFTVPFWGIGQRTMTR
jgi:hypothetical protein